MAACTPDSLHTNYAAAGFGRTLTPGVRPALLLVDFAQAYFDRSSPLYASVESARGVAGQLASAAYLGARPVVFTRVEYDPSDPKRDGGHFYRKIAALTVFDRGNPLGDFTPELRPAKGDIVVTKQYPSAFFGTDLAAQLKALDVDTLVIGGLTTSGCVRASALDALCHGFVPLIVEQACGDRDPRVQAANLFDLSAKYADIVNEQWALGYLRGSDMR